MLLNSWSRLIYRKNGQISKYSRRIKPLNQFKCDDCGIIWIESSKISKRFDKWGSHLCHKCLKIRNNKLLVEVGTLALKRRTPEERKEHAIIGSNASIISPNRDTYSFNIGRWNNMSEEEKKTQVNKASNGLQTKLKDPVFRENHFNKIFKNSKIGYISEGQQEVFDNLITNKITGFVLDGQILSMKVDIINYDLKIAIEYHGDYYHCNPRIWSSEEYNNTIRMTASEKWRSDNRRKRMLMNLGYKVIIIWESGWKNNPNKYIKRIQKQYENNIK